jgi:hypothetical protein
MIQGADRKEYFIPLQRQSHRHFKVGQIEEKKTPAPKGGKNMITSARVEDKNPIIRILAKCPRW